MKKHYNFLYLILVASLVSIIISCGQETLSDKEIEATVQARVEDKMANMPTPTPNIEATVQARVFEEMQKNQDAVDSAASNDRSEENDASPNIAEAPSKDQNRDENEIKSGDAEGQEEINKCTSNSDYATGLCVDGEEEEEVAIPAEQETCNTDANASTGYCKNGIAVEREDKDQKENSLIGDHNDFSSQFENKSNDDQSDKTTVTLNWIGPESPMEIWDYDVNPFDDYKTELEFEDYDCQSLGIAILAKSAPWDPSVQSRLADNWNQPVMWGLANITTYSYGDSYLECKADARIYEPWQIESNHPGYDKIRFRVTKGCLMAIEYICGTETFTGYTWHLEDRYIEKPSGYVRQSESDGSY